MLYTILINDFLQLTFQLYISELVFLRGVQKKDKFIVRLMIGIIINLLLSFLLQIGIKGYAYNHIMIAVFLYLGYALLTMIPIFLSWDIRLLEAIFILAGGYATEHMTFSLSKILLYVLGLPYDTNGNIAYMFLTRYIFFVLGAIVVYYVIVRKRSYHNGFKAGDLRITFLAVIVMISAIGLSVYWSLPETYQGTLIGELICPAYSFMCCLMVLFMEYYVLRENNMKHEQQLMEQLLHMSKVQQKSSQEAIDIINIKCHDLKHQIRALESIEDIDSRAEYLKEIQEAVSIYDATYHSGCKALDYILREKTLLFNEKNVEFSCILEGSMIDYISSADIYALIGNALDNALERVEKEAEDERVISLKIKHRNKMVLIHLENRCSSNIIFKDGLPLTDKKNKAQHGFGVQSIKYIVEKYNGDMIMEVKDGKFCLDILFPI